MESVDTHDTQIPVSKKFLKQTILENDAVKIAYDELMKMYNVMADKKRTEKRNTLHDKIKIYNDIHSKIMEKKKIKYDNNNEDKKLLKILINNINKKKHIIRDFVKNNKNSSNLELYNIFIQ